MLIYIKFNNANIDLVALLRMKMRRLMAPSSRLDASFSVQLRGGCFYVITVDGSGINNVQHNSGYTYLLR